MTEEPGNFGVLINIHILFARVSVNTGREYLGRLGQIKFNTKLWRLLDSVVCQQVKESKISNESETIVRISLRLNNRLYVLRKKKQTKRPV